MCMTIICKMERGGGGGGGGLITISKMEEFFSDVVSELKELHAPSRPHHY